MTLIHFQTKMVYDRWVARVVGWLVCVHLPVEQTPAISDRLVHMCTAGVLNFIFFTETMTDIYIKLK